VYQVLALLQQAGVAKVGLMSAPETGNPNARP
jgi:biopolymer transport protein TolR